MARTLGRRWPSKDPSDYSEYCDYCGSKHPRSRLVRDGAGLLKCKKHGDGLAAVELDELNRLMAVRAYTPERYD